MFAKSIAAVVAAVILANAAPAQSAEPPPFRFSFSTAELTNQRAALETRLRAETGAYCRRVGRGTSASVISRGCQRALIEAARAALDRAHAGPA